MTVTDDVQKSAQAPRLRIDRLDAALRAAGLTKTDLRLRAQLSEKYLAKMRVHRNPESAYLARIADAVGVSTDWLLGRSPDPGRAISGQFRDWIVEEARASPG